MFCLGSVCIMMCKCCASVFSCVCVMLYMKCGIGDRTCMALCSHAGVCVSYIYMYIWIYMATYVYMTI